MKAGGGGGLGKGCQKLTKFFRMWLVTEVKIGVSRSWNDKAL